MGARHRESYSVKRHKGEWGIEYLPTPYGIFAVLYWYTREDGVSGTAVH